MISNVLRTQSSSQKYSGYATDIINKPKLGQCTRNAFKQSSRTKSCYRTFQSFVHPRIIDFFVFLYLHIRATHASMIAMGVSSSGAVVLKQKKISHIRSCKRNNLQNNWIHKALWDTFNFRVFWEIFRRYACITF